MTVLERATELISLIEPDILRELETEFGPTFRDELKKEVAAAVEGSNTPERGTTEAAVFSVKVLSDKEFRKAFSYRQAVVVGQILGVKNAERMNYNKLVRAIYEE